MSCVLVGNFVQLVLARIAAAVGEAGCMPPTYSLVGDYYPQPAERTRALTIYALAGPLASLVSFVAGGQLNERFGWRATFFAMGIPALLVAVLIKMTVVEPRLNASRGAQAKRDGPRFIDVMRALWQLRASRHLIFALILVFTLGLGLAPWYAAFLMRSHGMDSAELGAWLGLIFCVGGGAGILWGGYVAARWFANDERNQMRLSAVTMATLVPCFALFLLAPRTGTALTALAVLVVISSCFLGPTFALMQRLVSDEMRATTLAVVMLLANLIGMGIGPQIVGALSDELRDTLGADSLRYAMLLMSLTALWAGWHFWQVGRTVGEDLLLTVKVDTAR
jgi:MFS family permease